MVRVVAFNGSPRKDGNTTILLNRVLEELKKEDIETELIQLAGETLSGCNACYQCRESKDQKCAITNDRVNEYIAKMKDAQGILLGSPTYISDMTVNIAFPLPPQPGRRDLTDLPVFTMDSETTRDVDDAVSIERSDAACTVGIHIADVAHVILPETRLHKDAAERTASLYLPEGKIPMLPPLLSEDVLSLVQGKTRPAISIIVQFDRSFNLLGFEIFPSTIMVKRRYSYMQADSLIEGDNDLSCLLRLAQHLRAARLSAGALLLPIPELTITVTDEGAIQMN